MLFLQQLAKYLDEGPLARDVFGELIKGLLLMVFLPIAVFAGLCAALVTLGRQMGQFLIGVVALGVVLINYLFGILNLIGQARSAIRPDETERG
jgi:hypothetical protein